LLNDLICVRYMADQVLINPNHHGAVYDETSNKMQKKLGKE